MSRLPCPFFSTVEGVIAMPRLVDRSARPFTGARHPCWGAVEELIAELGASGEPFSGEAARTYRIVRFDPGWRVRVEGGSVSRWVEVEDIRSCWETFERLGRIGHEDVLEPARCASFIMALFAHVPAVRRVKGDTLRLALPRLGR